MSNIEIKAAELIIAPKKEGSRAFLDTFIFEPENIEEQNLGNLYIAGEIAKVSSNSEYLINLLVATIKKEYYSNSSRSPIENMEQSLNKTNELLADFAEQGNIEWIGNLHMAIAVLKNNTLFFSQTGMAQTFLLRGQTAINIGQDLARNPKPHPLKTFSNIASGEISGADKVIIATSEFRNIASEEKIKSIFGDELNEEFEKKLESSAGDKLNAAIIILEAKEKIFSTGISFTKIPTKPNLEALGANKLDLRESLNFSKNSRENDNRVEEVINELNSQELKIPVSKKVKNAAKTAKFIVENIKKIVIAVYIFSKKFFSYGYSVLKPKISSLIGRLSLKIRIFSKNAKSKIQSAPAFSAITEKYKNAKNIAANKINAVVPRFIKNISPRNKIIIAASAVIFLAATIGAGEYIKIDNEKKNIEFYSGLLETAQKAQEEAEIADIYQEKDKTINLIRAALSASEKIIQSGYFTEDARIVKEKAMAQMDRIEGITRIDNPRQIADFAANSKSIRADGLVFLSKKLYSFNSENNAIYKYDFAKENSEIMAVNSKDIGHLKISKPANDKIIFLTDIPGAASYEPSKSEIKKLSIKFADEEKEIADIEFYSQNSGLYVLSKNNNEIYKHRAIAGGFAIGEKWLKNTEENPLSNPVSLAIDGNIYVLQNNSAEPIIKLAKGNKAELLLPELLMPLKEAVKIATDINMANLYVLDPKNKRIVVISKNGKTIKQFISEKFDALKDMAINPDEKEIYILNGTAVYEIKL